MRALSLWQPWASAIALKLKLIETRGWSTGYRGQLAIHAAKRWTREEREFLADMRMIGRFPCYGDLPFGAIVAVVNVDDCVRTEQLINRITALETSWGNYDSERYGFLMSNIRALPVPISFKGAQGFFNVPDSLIEQSL